MLQENVRKEPMKEATYTQKGDDGLPLWSIVCFAETQEEAALKLAEALLNMRGKGRNEKVQMPEARLLG